MTALNAPRRIELEEKLAALSAELEEWRRASAPNTDLEKHQSQIARTTATLDVLVGAASRKLKELEEQPAPEPADAFVLERTILDLHRLWDFFRGKFALRSMEWYRRRLVAADELTWACYSCVQKVARQGRVLKEPPLVFLNGAASPFALSRGVVYEPERVPGEPVQSDVADQALRKLPISVIGIPWFQLRHLPDAPVLCHEVGHTIEDDFGLGEPLAQALEKRLTDIKVPEGRRARWAQWQGETFADVCGCAGAGSAFGTALVDFLHRDTDSGNAWLPKEYPTPALRARIVLAAVEEKSADALRQRWKEVLDDDRPEFYADVRHVVDVLLNTELTELGGESIGSVMRFGRSDEASAREMAEQLLDREPTTSGNPRLIVAAARIAFESDPERYRLQEVGEFAADLIASRRESGPRALNDTYQVDDADLVAADEALGSELFDLIQSANEKRHDDQ